MRQLPGQFSKQSVGMGDGWELVLALNKRGGITGPEMIFSRRRPKRLADFSNILVCSGPGGARPQGPDQTSLDSSGLAAIPTRRRRQGLLRGRVRTAPAQERQARSIFFSSPTPRSRTFDTEWGVDDHRLPLQKDATVSLMVGGSSEIRVSPMATALGRHLRQGQGVVAAPAQR